MAVKLRSGYFGLSEECLTTAMFSDSDVVGRALVPEWKGTKWLLVVRTTFHVASQVDKMPPLFSQLNNQQLGSQR